MCLDNEKDPTKEEKEAITSGYKVFMKNVSNNMMVGVYSDFFYRKGWNHAIEGEIDSWSDSYGFHVYRFRRDAEIARDQYIAEGRKEAVVRKVKIRKILKLGRTSGMGEVRNGRLALRCEEMKILRW